MGNFYPPPFDGSVLICLQGDAAAYGLHAPHHDLRKEVEEGEDELLPCGFYLLLNKKKHSSWHQINHSGHFSLHSWYFMILYSV